MMIEEIITKVIRTQKGKKTLLKGQWYYPVDISMLNGNIMLRAFRIHSIEENKIKGLTWKEEYSAPRESRAPIFCYLAFDEIASLSCHDLELEYIRKS